MTRAVSFLKHGEKQDILDLARAVMKYREPLEDRLAHLLVEDMETHRIPKRKPLEMEATA